MQKGPPTPKGFRDVDPDLAKKRRQVINRIVDVLEGNGFVPLETPTIEFAETLKGKYGEEERLIYEFTDRGGRRLALRYDLTVPLARYVAAKPSLKMPFRRYQIGQVFRGENPQHGRYREFTQLDLDTVGPPRLASLDSAKRAGEAGSSDLAEDAKIIAAAIKAAKIAGIKNPRMKINDRQNFAGLPIEVVRALDKLDKIGEEEVLKDLTQKGLSKSSANTILHSIVNKKATTDLQNIFEILNNKYRLSLGSDFIFDPTLARGLDYYTGSIFELKPNDNPISLSIGSGGRYDNLIGMFVYPAKGGARKKIPAVGFSFGIDRLIEATSK